MNNCEGGIQLKYKTTPAICFFFFQIYIYLVFGSLFKESFDFLLNMFVQSPKSSLPHQIKFLKHYICVRPTYDEATYIPAIAHYCTRFLSARQKVLFYYISRCSLFQSLSGSATALSLVTVFTYCLRSLADVSVRF